MRRSSRSWRSAVVAVDRRVSRRRRRRCPAQQSSPSASTCTVAIVQPIQRDQARARTAPRPTRAAPAPSSCAPARPRGTAPPRRSRRGRAARRACANVRPTRNSSRRELTRSRGVDAARPHGNAADQERRRARRCKPRWPTSVQPSAELLRPPLRIECARGSDRRTSSSATARTCRRPAYSCSRSRRASPAPGSSSCMHFARARQRADRADAEVRWARGYGGKTRALARAWACASWACARTTSSTIQALLRRADPASRRRIDPGRSRAARERIEG